MNVLYLAKLIDGGASFNITDKQIRKAWPAIAKMGNVKLLKYMFNHGIDKDSTDMKGRTMLSYVVASGNIEAIRYVLDLGVTLPNYPPGTDEMRCRHCAANRLLLKTVQECTSSLHDPCMVACELNMPQVVQLLEEYGGENFKFTYALRHAMEHHSVKVVAYLLKKYNYPLNDEYFKEPYTICRSLLSDASRLGLQKVVQLLLNHGADPYKKICDGEGFNFFTAIIIRGYAGVLAGLIRCGVDFNQKLHGRQLGYISSFELSVRCNNIYAAEMFLILGYTGGMNSLAKMHPLKPKLLNLLMEWNLHENNVQPLKRQCRRVLLNHLTPQADKKIKQLPLPPMLITYLNIPEIDGIVDAYNIK